MSKNKKIAIVGAGISGLSCATALQKAGFDVTVFEKSLGVSGRLSTRLTEHWQCDHGAQYFTARDQIFNTEVQRWIEADVAQLWQPRLMETDGITFSAKESATRRYVGYPYNSSPAKWLAQTLNICKETNITGLQRIDRQWQITSKEHGIHMQYYDYVLLAIPAPQAAVLLKHSLSKLYDVAANIKMNACFALIINLQNTLHCDFDGLFVNNGLLSWIAHDSAKPGRINSLNQNKPLTSDQTWILHARSLWSEQHINHEKEIVSKAMIAEFMRLVCLTQANVPAPLSHILHRWLYAECDHYLTCGYQLDQQYNIGLCGDWLNGGKVQGAWLSGLLLANQLIAV
jgi:renalase